MTSGDLEQRQPFVWVNPELKNEDFPGKTVVLRYGFGPVSSDLKNKKIFFFDIDNCLYQRSTRIHDMMQVKIHDYFKRNLNLSDDDAHRLHMTYYKTYGLALEGLVRNHDVDALEYNSQVDDALDLKSALNFNPALRDMLIKIKEHEDFDMLWLMTNAYKNHALRVISFLGLGDLFDGLSFCDYSKCPIICKPMKEYFHLSLLTAGIDYDDSSVMTKQSFVDDSEINVKAAFELGFGNVIHYVEIDSEFQNLKAKPDFYEYYGKGDNSDSNKIYIIRSILDLDSVL